MKKSVFLILLLVTAAVLILPWAKEAILKKEAEEGITLRPGEYKIGKDLPEGRYDLRFKGEIILQGKVFDEGDELKATRFLNDELLFIEGNGDVSLSPAEFAELKVQKNNSYTISDSGFYQVNQQIAEGDYILRYKGAEAAKTEAFVQTLDQKDNIIETYSFQDKEEHEVILKKNTVLQVEKSLMEEISELQIILEKKQ